MLIIKPPFIAEFYCMSCVKQVKQKLKMSTLVFLQFEQKKQGQTFMRQKNPTCLVTLYKLVLYTALNLE